MPMMKETVRCGWQLANRIWSLRELCATIKKLRASRLISRMRRTSDISDARIVASRVIRVPHKGGIVTAT